jgi:hypothetical protein
MRVMVIVAGLVGCDTHCDETFPEALPGRYTFHDGAFNLLGDDVSGIVVTIGAEEVEITLTKAGTTSTAVYRRGEAYTQ